MKSHITVGKRLALCFGTLFLLLLGLAYSSLSSTSRLNAALDTVLNKTAKKSELAGQMDASAAYLRAGQRGVILYSMLKDADMVDKSQAIFAQHTGRIENAINEIRSMLVTDAGRQAAEDIQAQVLAWQPLYQQVVKMSAAGQFTEIGAVVNQTIVIADSIQKSCELLQGLQKELLGQATKESAVISFRARWLAIILLIICVPVGGFVGWLIRNISGNLRRIAWELSAVPNR